MRANVGDDLIVGARGLGRGPRRAEIVEVIGPDGTPPFRVRWLEDGRESVVAPAAGMTVEGRTAVASPEAPAPDAPVGAIPDPELRLARLEETAEAMGWQLERLREDLRGLAAAVRP